MHARSKTPSGLDSPPIARDGDDVAPGCAAVAGRKFSKSQEVYCNFNMTDFLITTTETFTCAAASELLEWFCCAVQDLPV